MTYLFISDLHLSPEHPRLIQGFLALLQHYQDKDTQLYILGDWFNAWIGDDNDALWLKNIVSALQQFQHAGNAIYFQVGNRDFALTQMFLDKFNGQLLPDEYTFQVNNHLYRLEHGDALCTDDVAYQRFKKIIRNPVLLAILRKTPLSFRQKLATGFRKKSSYSKQQKNVQIMDVNQDTVDQALKHIDVLIHGHTHRPQIHHESEGKTRIVLGDWRENIDEDTGEAMILEITDQLSPHFFKWLF
ncbi:MAG: UDP-2,3-diacylglucosamine diphosphatase [Acinetobacter sp.]